MYFKHECSILCVEWCCITRINNTCVGVMVQRIKTMVLRFLKEKEECDEINIDMSGIFLMLLLVLLLLLLLFAFSWCGVSISVIGENKMERKRDYVCYCEQ